MPTAQQNTKVETLVEAIENFAIVVARGVIGVETGRISGVQAQLIADERTECRADMASALRDFLQPSLRVITEREERVGDLSTISRKTIERTDAVATKTFTIPR